MEANSESIKLTQYSHGAGCGCKIAPGVLDQILNSTRQQHFSGLLVGYEHKDDAAAFLLNENMAIISTTDFFMPVVDDPFDFGRIASVNAISDVYAMGGTPLMAIGILGWPVDKIPVKFAEQVLQGAKEICKQASIPLAGGHSIDCPEPIFGLAVTGCIHPSMLKKNSDACAGDLIYLTKGLGVGILTTAEKKSILESQHSQLAKDSMLKLNDIGALISKHKEVHCMTDVTGFGLCGHLLEVCEASNLNAQIHYVNLPVLDPCVFDYIQRGAVPGGTMRNWKSYSHKIDLKTPDWFNLLADPQTSGGLLIFIDPSFKNQLEQILIGQGIPICQIGQMLPEAGDEKRVFIS